MTRRCGMARKGLVSISRSDDKVRVLIKLDAMGFDYVEGGYPLSNPDMQRSSSTHRQFDWAGLVSLLLT